MFDFLKKKIASWLKPAQDEKSKKEKKKDSLNKKKEEDKNKIKKSKKKNKDEIVGKTRGKIDIKNEKNLTKDEKERLVESEEIIKEAETPLEVQIESEISREEVKESEKIEEKGNFFTRLIRKISNSKLSEEDFKEAFQDLEITLLENNVALEAVDKIRDSLSSRLVGQQMKKTEAPARILEALKDSILSLLIEPPSLINQIKNNSSIPFVIIFFGINGTGKTTSIAKIANLLKEQEVSCVLAAADTFRAASIEQLKTHGSRLNIPVIAQSYGSDPAAVVFDAINYAKTHGIKAVLIDTAGRMYTKSNLLKEMEKIIRVAKPNLKIFVGESITGNDALEQGKIFNEIIGIDGIILSKADVDEKAGTILSVSHVTGKPIYFLGTGQGYKDLMPFTKKSVLKNLGLE